MTAPNIVSATSVTARTVLKNLGTITSGILTNGASSDKLYKISALMVANKSAAPAAVTITIATIESDIGVLATLAHEIVVPANATLTIINRNTPIYLQEEASIAATASTENALDVICAYEEVI